MDSVRGRDLHQQALQAQEAGNSLEALKLYDEAMIAYSQDKDVLGFAEVVAARSIALRHLAQKNDDQKFVVVAKGEMEASVEIVRQSGTKEALAIPIYNLGKVYEELKEYDKAVKAYQDAIDHQSRHPADRHNRPAVLADMKVHLHYAEYKNGDKSARDRMLAAMSELETAEGASDYERKVWLSGGHMSLAEMLREDDPEVAKEHLSKAKEIIDSDEALKIRRQQWEKLAAQFS